MEEIRRKKELLFSQRSALDVQTEKLSDFSSGKLAPEQFGKISAATLPLTALLHPSLTGVEADRVSQSEEVSSSSHI